MDHDIRQIEALRKDVVASARRIVIKIGSKVLTDTEGGLDARRISSLCSDIARLRERGTQVVLVSSGAIAAGRGVLGMAERPRTIPQKQAAAAVGQSRLMRAYEEAFAPFGISVAQMLLTREDLANRSRFLNACSTLDTLLGYGIIPVINENDTVVVDEIKFGDNDNLSALVATMSDAHLLIMLTDIEGLYSADPRICPDARLLPLVRNITRDVEKMAGGTSSAVGTGGMTTKLAAARKSVRNGIPAIMACGTRSGIIESVMSGDNVGTLFTAPGKSINRRKHWIAYTLRATGRIYVDRGASEALLTKGTSLLPSGVTGVEGRFDRGGCVKVCRQDGKELARGLADYSSTETLRLMGRKSSDIESLLGYHYSDVIIHRDNMAFSESD